MNKFVTERVTGNIDGSLVGEIQREKIMNRAGVRFSTFGLDVGSLRRNDNEGMLKCVSLSGLSKRKEKRFGALISVPVGACHGYSGITRTR